MLEMWGVPAEHILGYPYSMDSLRAMSEGWGILGSVLEGGDIARIPFIVSTSPG